MRQAVIFIHGIGKHAPGFSASSEEAIREELSSLLGGAPEPDLIYKEAVWAQVLSGYQQDLWRRVKRGNGKKELDMVKLRRFMIHFLGDAITYQNDDVVAVDRNGAWVNILDDEDIIAYPLRGINDAYKQAVDLDYITETGGILSAGNPLSHMGYWDDRNVYNPIAKKLAMCHERIVNGKPYRKTAYMRYIHGLWNF